MNRRAPIVVHLDESVSAAEMPWKRLAVHCMRYLSREHIEAACVAAGFARPAFTASGPHPQTWHTMIRAEYATVRLSRAQLQAIYEKLYPDYRAELLSGVEGQKASPLALAFVKVAEAWSGLDDEQG